MATDTRDKLDEAAFFQACLSAEKDDPGHYRYYMSAFVSSARSVTFFMQKEYAHQKGFEAWYLIQRAKMEADAEMKFFHDQRVEAIHLSRVKLAEHGAIGKLRIGGEVTVVIEDLTSGKSETRVVPAKTMISSGGSEPIEWTWYFDQRLTKSSTQMSSEHLGKLAQLVDECEKKFGAVKATDGS